MHCSVTPHPSPVGRLAIASKGGSLVGLWLEGQKHFGGGVTGEMAQANDEPVLAQTKDWLARYFAGERPDVGELPLAPAGSDFQLAVWRLLLEIPYGQTVTYGEIAKRLAERTNRGNTSARAIGGAVGRNPISIIIPCHRVVGAGGKLTGYAGGLDRKLKLLEIEGVCAAKLR